jgi:hypothetical protein
VRPDIKAPAHHLSLAVTGHAAIAATIADHLNRAYAAHEGLAVDHPAPSGQALP